MWLLLVVVVVAHRRYSLICRRSSRRRHCSSRRRRRCCHAQALMSLRCVRTSDAIVRCKFLTIFVIVAGDTNQIFVTIASLLLHRQQQLIVYSPL